MSSREVLTFQLGNYSNYIGAHWWNIQESYFQYDKENPSEINHDVLFREGKTLKGLVTFTPRVIVVDKAENMVNVPVLFESDIKSQRVSTEKKNVIQEVTEPVVEKHEFIKDLERMEKGHKVDFIHKNYNFNETVRTWTDYLKTRFHERSVCTVRNSSPTEVFHSGGEIYETFESDLIERIRCYMEECDNLQGFQVIVDATDGFGGLANSVLIHLQDEYSTKPIFTVPVLAKSVRDSGPLYDLKRTLNILLSYQKLTENSSLLVPLGTNTTAWRSFGPPTVFPNLNYIDSNYYHTSAIIASFLDTATLKYRLREDSNCMHDFVSGLNYYNKKVCAATTSLPFPIAPDSYLLDTLENLDDSMPLWSQLTPGCNVTEDKIFYQKITVRGIPVNKLRNPEPSSSSRSSSRAYSCSSVEELVLMYLSFRLTTISNVTSVALPLKTALPYPKIFSPHVSPNGYLHENSTRMENYEVNSCPMITGLHCCKAVGLMLDSLHQSVKTINIKKFHQFFGTYMDADEFSECLEKLLAMGYGNASDVELR